MLPREDSAWLGGADAPPMSVATLLAESDNYTDIDTVVAALGHCPAVRARLEALAAASCSLVLFCEYIPHPLLDWLRENPAGKAATVERHSSQYVSRIWRTAWWKASAERLLFMSIIGDGRVGQRGDLGCGLVVYWPQCSGDHPGYENIELLLHDLASR